MGKRASWETRKELLEAVRRLLREHRILRRLPKTRKYRLTPTGAKNHCHDLLDTKCYHRTT